MMLGMMTIRSSVRFHTSYGYEHAGKRCSYMLARYLGLIRGFKSTRRRSRLMKYFISPFGSYLFILKHQYREISSLVCIHYGRFYIESSEADHCKLPYRYHGSNWRLFLGEKGWNSRGRQIYLFETCW